MAYYYFGEKLGKMLVEMGKVKGEDRNELIKGYKEDVMEERCTRLWDEKYKKEEEMNGFANLCVLLTIEENEKRKKMVVHCKKEKFDVYIGRGGMFGNPYTHLEGKTLAKYKVASRNEAVEAYEPYARERMKNDEEFKKAVAGLWGKVVGCFCTPLRCHGEILVRLADELHR